MNDVLPSTVDELQQKWMQALCLSEKAIRSHPAEYRELKNQLDHIVSETIDIGQYFQTARRLSGLLEIFCQTHPGSIFQYFYRNIDPLQEGDVRFLRIHCRDLDEQLRSVQRLSAERRHIRLVT